MKEIITPEPQVNYRPLANVDIRARASAKEVVVLWQSVLDSPNNLLTVRGMNTFEAHEAHGTEEGIFLCVSATVKSNGRELYQGQIGFVDKKDTLEMHASFDQSDLLQRDLATDTGFDIILDYFRSHVNHRSN